MPDSEFIREIEENPDDQAFRLVYAGLLEEQGIFEVNICEPKACSRL